MSKYMRKILSSSVFTIALLLVLAISSGCSTVSKTIFYGNKKQFKGLELYHSGDIPESQVNALGAFLIRTKFAQDSQSSARISKVGDGYVFQMPIKPGMSYMQHEFLFRDYAKQMSEDVFGNQPVSIHACDEYLNTLAKFQMR